jgi:hypothetical protein
MKWTSNGGEFMETIFPEMTVAKVLEINPRAAQVLFRYGLRSFFAPGIANETLEGLSEVYQFDLTAVVQDLNQLIKIGSDFLRKL